MQRSVGRARGIGQTGRSAAALAAAVLGLALAFTGIGSGLARAGPGAEFIGEMAIELSRGFGVRGRQAGRGRRR